MRSFWLSCAELGSASSASQVLCLIFGATFVDSGLTIGQTFEYEFNELRVHGRHHLHMELKFILFHFITERFDWFPDFLTCFNPGQNLMI